MSIPNRIGSQYEHQLACVYHKVAKRGLLTDAAHLTLFRDRLVSRVRVLCDELSTSWSTTVYIGRFDMAQPVKGTDALNLNAPLQVIKQLKKLGYKVPKVRGTETETADALAMLKLFAQTGDQNLQKIMEIAKIKKVISTNINARKIDDIYFSQYNTSATLSGRRGSTKHIFGVGGNAQNWTKYTALGQEFRECFITRPGKIFFSVDQMQAEDWIVVALSSNHTALAQMLAGVDRHKKLAAFLFAMPEDKILKHPHRFLGKKFRHANNYGMWKNTASDNLAREGFAFSPSECEYMLKKVNEYDPSIKGVFHKYVESCLSKDRKLATPLGRERYFIGLRPRGDNTRVFMEAYSYIPQSSVADNTGLAMLWMDSFEAPIVQECHDSIVLEIDDTEEAIKYWREKFVLSFDRELAFDTGITVKIPLEGELGYDLKNMVAASKLLSNGVKSGSIEETDMIEAWRKVKFNREEKLRNAKADSGELVSNVS